ncbi:MAG: hypothetical protein R6V14_07285 [Halanaerobiales bacterium]
MELITVNQAYTFSCTAIDLEKINKENYNKSNIGLTINAELNGSLNIMRKFLNKKCIPELVNQARDNGVVDPPSRLRIA